MAVVLPPPPEELLAQAEIMLCALIKVRADPSRCEDPDFWVQQGVARHDIDAWWRTHRAADARRVRHNVAEARCRRAAWNGENTSMRQVGDIWTS